MVCDKANYIEEFIKANVEMESTSESSEDEVFTGFSEIRETSHSASINNFTFASMVQQNRTLSREGLSKDLEPAAKRSKKSGSNIAGSSLERELHSFFNEDPAELETDPLVWWKENENQYPKIAKWAKRLLGAPPSSVESERLFSIEGNIYTPKRNRLTAENGETLMLLNFNLRAFNFDY